MNAMRTGRAVILGLLLSWVSYAIAQDDAAKEPKESSAIPGGELQILNAEGQPLAVNGQTAVCPLKRTEVEANVTGFIARVNVRQTFHNPLDRKIEAVYVFPLPQDAAVDDMLMAVGDRRIAAQIKPRGEAKQIYEAAKSAGHVAGLLDQERPNIFTQSVANIEPGVEVVIDISYVETLKFEDGVFEWVFPMVVGPRYIPGGGSAPAPLTTGQPTPQVPDANKITPPITPKGTRAGHDIAMTVRINSGSPDLLAEDITSKLHEIDVQTRPASFAAGQVITLKNKAEIPNKDFILRYRLGTDKIEDEYIVSADPRGPFFTLILQPPRRVTPAQLVPRELVFVLDTSGSMQGFPIDKAKEVMAKMIDSMQPVDTFNMITFSGDTHILWSAPRPNTPENRKEAQNFLASRQGGGGTEMMKAIHAALVQTRGTGAAGFPVPISPAELSKLPADGREVAMCLRACDIETAAIEGQGPVSFMIPTGSGDPIIAPLRSFQMNKRPYDEKSTEMVSLRGRWITKNGKPRFDVEQAEWPAAEPVKAAVPNAAGVQPIRIVCFMTDGYVGNDFEIIDAVKKNAATTRVFSFGIGNSVNRFLLDGMANAGRGEVEYVQLNSQADGAVERFHERVLAPVLTDIQIDWGTLPVADVYPKQIPDLFSSKPLVIHGRLTKPDGGEFTLRGNTGSGPFLRKVAVRPPMLPDGGMAAAKPVRGDPAVSLWARSKIDFLMNQDLAALQHGQFPKELEEAVTALGVEYRLMTQFTSFVAVEEMTVTVGGQPIKISVPVEMPDGVSYEGVFGDELREGGGFAKKTNLRGRMVTRSPAGWTAGRGGGVSAQPSAPPPPTGKPAQVPQEALRRAKGGETAQPRADVARQLDKDKEDDAPPADPAAVARAKLAEPLRGVAEKVVKEGKDGNLTVGKLSVKDYKIDVMIYLRDTSDKTLEALKKLGFAQAGESKAVRLLIGALDVRKLEELSKLDAVLRVEPVLGQ